VTQTQDYRAELDLVIRKNVQGFAAKHVFRWAAAGTAFEHLEAVLEPRPATSEACLVGEPYRLLPCWTAWKA
jgi:hypothetical protein